MRKKRKVEELKVDTIDWTMVDNLNQEEYWGKVVKDDNSYAYCNADGRTMSCIDSEIAKLLLGQEVTVIEVVEHLDTPPVITSNQGSSSSLIDCIGAKPKNINIDF